MNKIAQGAEAILFQNGADVIKERFSKKYRNSQLDESLRSFRTRREAKILQKLETIHFPAPHLKEFSDKRMSLVMDFVPGAKLKDALNETCYQRFAEEVGQKIGQLHNANIIHGDLTPSNMLVHQKSDEVVFIDFGLSFFSQKEEDKAVDLFLLDRALASTHYDFYPSIFDHVIKGYKVGNENAQNILERLEIVKKRGRNKKK